MNFLKLKKYYIYTYLLLFRYKFYDHFINLVFLKIKNLFTSYEIIERGKNEKIRSEEICNIKFLENDFFFKNLSKNKLNFNIFENELKIHQQQYNESFKKKGPANLYLLFFCSNLISAKNILETGVADGWSSLAFLIYLRQIGGKLTSIDMPYLNSFSKYKCGKIINKNLRTSWELIIKPDTSGIKILSNLSRRFDLIHYDSDKSIEGRKKNYPKLWKMLNIGGIFISDDISDNMSFFNFCHKNNLKYHVVKYENKFQGVVFKDRIK